MLFIPARYAGPRRLATPQTLDVIVIHTAEITKHLGDARSVANWFHGPTSSEASTHYCVDSTEIVQCVPLGVVAWGAKGANRNGIHIEHAGFARQSDADWSDAYSSAMLHLSAELARSLADSYEIPIVKLSAADLLAGQRGFCGHADVSEAFEPHNPKRHWDPGPRFPWSHYMLLVESVRPPVDAA